MTLARTRRGTEDCELVGENGDADESEVSLGSSRRTLQVELESEFKAITLSLEKGVAALACEPVFAEGAGTHSTV